MYIFDLDMSAELSVLHRWIHVYYIKGQSMWNVGSRQGDSVWLKGILRVRDHILQHCSMSDLNQVSFFSHSAILTHFYDLFCPHAPECFHYHLIRNKFVVPRVSFCTWLVVLNRLHTKVRLKQWVYFKMICALCVLLVWKLCLICLVIIL